MSSPEQGAQGGERGAGVNPNEPNPDTHGAAREVEESGTEEAGPTPGGG